jgi:hypothetical protein
MAGESLIILDVQTSMAATNRSSERFLDDPVVRLRYFL